MPKIREYREDSDDQLAVRLDEERQELFTLRFKHATGQLTNSGSLGRLRKNIARLETLIRQRELGIDSHPEAHSGEGVQS